MRYVLHDSSVFDNPPFFYDTELFKKVIKNSGGKNIRTSNNFGWSNQPRVVTFNADEQTKTVIKNELDKLPIFKTWGCIIFEKDW